MLDIILGLMVLGLFAIVAVGLVCAWLILPISDLLNGFLRRIGLAGPSPGTRSVGVHAVGRVDAPFAIHEGRGVGKVFVGGETWNAVCDAPLIPVLAAGDSVEIAYNEDLTVTVLGKTRPQEPVQS